MSHEHSFRNVAGNIINLRFDMGVARLVKDLSGGDDIIRGSQLAYDELGALLTVAAYIRYCFVHKLKAEFTEAELKDFFFELDMQGAADIFTWYNKSQEMRPVPESAQIKEGEEKK